jgi:hypothetical protein
MLESEWDEDPLYLPPEDPELERALRTAKGSSRLVMPLDWQCVVCGFWHSSAETSCRCGHEPEPGPSSLRASQTPVRPAN